MRVPAIIAAMTAATALADCRTLGSNDYSYYRWNGKVGTFAMKTVAVTTDLATRQKFWKEVAENTRPVIYQLMFRQRAGWTHFLPKTAEEATAEIDELFAPGDGVAPCLGKLFAVTPCEENIDWDGQVEVQDAIAKHLRNRYGVKTYQWLTEPYKPRLNIQADGWVFDAYSIKDPQKFYAHVESFILTGVPVVPCIWASGHFSKYHLDKTWDELTRFTVERMDICRALDLPVMVFAVAGKLGSVGIWFNDAEEPGERYYREAIKHYLAAVPTMPKASWKPAPKKWHARITPDGAAAARVDLRSFELVHDTEFDDVRAWRLGKDGLALLRESGRLNWRMESPGRIVNGRFLLRHSTGAKGTFCGKPLSSSGLTEVDADGCSSRLLELVAESPLTIAELTLSGKGEYAAETVDLRPVSSECGATYKRMVHFNASEGDIMPVAGRVARKRLVRRVPLPGRAGKVSIVANILAEKAHGGSVEVMASLSADGKPALSAAKTDPAKRFQKLPIEIDVAAETGDVYVVFDLVASSGVAANHLAARVYWCDIKFIPSS